jgi:hypothetical protein
MDGEKGEKRQAILGKFQHLGFRLEFPDDHVLFLFHEHEHVAIFSQTGATAKSIQMECFRWVLDEHKVLVNERQQNQMTIHKEFAKVVDIKTPQELNDTKRLLTTAEVAVILDVHTNTVRKWETLGLLKSFRIGPRLDRRFDFDTIQAFKGNQELVWRKT